MIIYHEALGKAKKVGFQVLPRPKSFTGQNHNYVEAPTVKFGGKLLINFYPRYSVSGGVALCVNKLHKDTPAGQWLRSLGKPREFSNAYGLFFTDIRAWNYFLVDNFL